MGKTNRGFGMHHALGPRPANKLRRGGDKKSNPGSDPLSFTGSVTLRKRVSKNVYDLETVRLIPRPPLEIDSAAEAKHYAATYALFRVRAIPRFPTVLLCADEKCVGLDW